LNDCIVISDLHLFSQRSQADEHLPRIHAAVRSSRALVLAGDIVDFKWSRVGSIDDTADAARLWLEELLDQNPEGELHYLLGNHDHVPALITRLESLAADCPRFRWHPYHLRLGNAVFLHGDVSNPGMNQAKLHAYRERFGQLDQHASGMSHVYDLVLALRLNVFGTRLLYPHGTVMRRILRYLEEVGDELSLDVRNVYFGHTHRSLSGEEHGGVRFHNCGAPIRGHDFRIITAELS